MKRKPLAIVSHGVNSGVRANEHLRQMVNSNMGGFPISATVTFMGKVDDALDENGVPKVENTLNDTKLDALLADIIWYTKAIKSAKDSDETNR
jgi:NAD(P)H-dependent FMN reductase